MKKYLDNIRQSENNINISDKIKCSALVLLLGIIWGILSKWLDNLSIDDTVLWQHIIGILDLGNIFSHTAIWFLAALSISVYSKTPSRACLNVFLFFVGLCVSYHLYSIIFCGFNPQRYMMIWYGLTIFSPIPAFICWYGKGKTKTSLIIDIFILTVMILSCFSIGFWYFNVPNPINILIFIAAIIILYITPKHTIISILCAAILAYTVRFFILYI